MNADEMWSQLCERHPMFRNPEHVVKLRARGLLALIEQAYEGGLLEGARKPVDTSVFDQLFGKGFKR